MWRSRGILHDTPDINCTRRVLYYISKGEQMCKNYDLLDARKLHGQIHLSPRRGNAASVVNE